MQRKMILFLMMIVLISVLTVGCTSEATPEVEETFKVAVVLPGPLDDASWNAAAYNAILDANEISGVEVVYAESVEVADVEQVLRDYADQGYKLILGHSFDFGDAIFSVAADYPDLYFGWGTGYDCTGNVACYDVLPHETSFLAGHLAGSLTESNVIGIVGTVDIPIIVIQVNGFIQGVEEVNPDAEILLTYVGSWVDPQGGREATEAQLSAGADIIYSLGDYTGLGATQAADEAGVINIGSTIDQYELAPNTMLTSVITDFSPVFESMIKDARDEAFKQEYIYSMAEGASYLAPYHNQADKVPDDLDAEIQSTAEAIETGELVIEPQWPE